MSYGYDYEEPEGFEGAGEQPSAGRGRRRKPAQEPETAVPQPQPQTQPQSGYYDAQWEQSGLGWDPQAWNEAQREHHAPDQYVPDQYAPDQYAPDQYQTDPYAADRYPADEYASDRYASDQQTYYESAPDYIDTDLEPRAEFTTPEFAAPEFMPPAYPGSEYPESEFAGPELLEPDYRSPQSARPEYAPPPLEDDDASADTSPAKQPSSLPGQGAFGAAGLAVVTGIGALVATPVLAVVVALSQIGLAVGWMRTVGTANTRRTTVFVAAVGLAAAALAYRLTPDRAPAAMGAALGVGFVFLAADQLFRKDTGVGRHRSEALAAAVTGAAFAVLPAGYLVAQRQDSALAGACALAAAVAVLCSALVGGGAKPLGIVAGVVAATALGTLSAVTLSASAGAKGGALGGLISGLLAVVGARTADRLGGEGGDVRISAQALPVAYAAVGAVIAAQVLR